MEVSDELEGIAQEMFKEIRDNPNRQERLEELLYLSMLIHITSVKQYDMDRVHSPTAMLAREIQREIGTPAEYLLKSRGMVVAENDNDEWFQI